MSKQTQLIYNKMIKYILKESSELPQIHFLKLLFQRYLNKKFPQLNYVLIKLWNFHPFG